MKKRRIGLAVVTLLGAAGVIAAWWQLAPRDHVWQVGQPIHRSGTYHFSNDDVLFVSDASGIVGLSFEADKHRWTLTSSVHASCYEDWTVVVGPGREIWLLSADIGLYVWRTNADGEMQERVLKPREIPADTPEQLRAEIAKWHIPVP